MAGQYQDRQDSKIYGSRLIIHRRVDLDNNNFYFRAKVSGHTGYIRRSCQTSDPARAMLRRKICGSICSVLENGQISDQTQAVFCSHNDDYWFCYTATCFFNFDGLVNISGVGIAISGRVYFTLANKLLCFSNGRISAAIVWCSLINTNRHKGSVIIKV